MTDRPDNDKTPNEADGNDPEPNRSALHISPGVTGDDGLPANGNDGADNGSAPRRRILTVRQYVDGVLAGDRGVLARAITLIESSAPAHQDLAQQVLAELLPQRGESIRVGITGVPGAGKSTFVEALGTRLTGRGHKVAVTAVDPSSSLSGGSILGDKTRMEKLAADPMAFIRPSPSSGTLGGVARKTRETIVLFEAAGFDVILVETVGVGQSEILVRSMVDFFLLMLIPGAGDELQGIKKGVVEIADAVLINKADGPGELAAARARSEFETVLHYLRPATDGWQTRAHTCSAATGQGIAEMWKVVETFVTATRASGVFAGRRSQQERQWVESLVQDGLQQMFRTHPAVRQAMAGLLDDVAVGKVTATAAAAQLLRLFRGD